MNNLKKKFLLLLLLVIIASCSNNLKTEGNFVFPNKLEKLHTGLSKTEVIDLLGPATIKASFDENTWYFIYEVSTKKLRFLDKSIVDSKVIIINFNANIIQEIQILDYNDRNAISIDSSKTKDILVKTKASKSRFKEIDTFK
jgi:outer membrane protein assembly factor BamE